MFSPVNRILFSVSYFYQIQEQLKEYVNRSRNIKRDRQYNDQNEGQTIQWPKWGTDNTMTKMRDRQYNDQNEGQTIQWPKWGTDNTMTKMRDRQYNDQNEGQNDK